MKNFLNDESKGFSDLTLHIVLATMPQRHSGLFNKCIVDGYYGKYRDTAADYLNEQEKEDGNRYGYYKDFKKPVLYNPLRYYILGNYDIAYISLIDNFKFAQRVFEPQLLLSEQKNPPKIFPPHTFQSFSGITHPDQTDLRRFFAKKLNENDDRRYFTAIVNLKLNNGFLIGNGDTFLKSAITSVKSAVAAYNASTVLPKGDRSVEVVIMQSFSWFEISAIIFADDPQYIASILKILRKSTVGRLRYQSKEIIDNSLYTSLLNNKYSPEDIGKANVFADSQTYFGIHADLIECKEGDPFLKAFRDAAIKLNTEVEWQIKPGHMAFLLDFLKKNAKSMFDWKKRFLLAGKNDYYLKSKSDLLRNNLRLLRIMYRQTEDSELYNHVRKIKTRVQFDDGPVSEVDSRIVLNLHNELVQNGVSIDEFRGVDEQLKSLKVSRQIRSKILKIFANYNNGIQDIILFPYFLDFKLFIDYLKNYIDNMGNKLKEKFNKPNVYYPELNMFEIEIALMNLIGIFQEGYNIRMLNGYQFEDINDFDLDFNSSIQQLLSVYSTLAIEVGNLFYEGEYFYGPIVQLNLKDTVANYVSINYYVNHLTSPEFVFATLTKEIFNFLYLGDEDIRMVVKRFERRILNYPISNDSLQELLSLQHVRMDYLINDATRFIITYDNDFELFQYWFWTYNLQNTSLYDETGAMNELHFRKELFRITFINRFFGHDLREMICPLPELYTFWDRHYSKTVEAVEDLLAVMHKANVTRDLMTYISQSLDTALKKTVGEWVTSDEDTELGVNFIKKINTRYYGQYNNNFFFARLSKKIRIYNMLKSGNRSEDIKEESVIFMQWYMLHSLRTIFDHNQRIVLLRRNWKTGMPLKSFMQHGSDGYLYAIDQTGGLFFDDVSSIASYFRISSAMISKIWDFAQRRKKTFIIKTLGSNGKK